MALVTHGVPVNSARQWTTGLSPNKTGTGWNFIAQSWEGPNPVEWVVIKDLTGTPTVSISTTANHIYANSTIGYNTSKGQLRALNGRIFWPCFGNYTAYYDPTSESVSLLGPFTESPAIDPNASTIPYSACFDGAGKLYFATQESADRPSCIVETDTDTLTQTVLGYVGDGQAGYTTYGYYIVADTGVAGKRYVYVAYGEDPWQLWALNIDTGIATKLYDGTSTGHIAFTEIAGQGWIATIDTNVGDPSNVETKYWCQDGTLSAYTVGVNAPAPRDVTPASNPLTSPPELDTTGGIGVVGWRTGGSGAYTYVDYSVTYTTPQAIESLLPTSSGLIGNAANYQGFFEYNATAQTLTWFGANSNIGIAQGTGLVASGVLYRAGYPDGVMYSYDPANPYQADALPTVNPALLGYYGPNGTEFAGIKYATQLAWSPGAGATGRLYCAGFRQRNGTGSGIGYYDLSTVAFAGTYASPLDTIYAPTGLVALDDISRVVMATSVSSGDAPMLVFDHDLNLVSQATVKSGLSNLGTVVATTTSGVVCGITQAVAGGILALYQFDVSTSALLQYTETGITGAIGVGAARGSDGTYWQLVGSQLVKVDPVAMTAVVASELDSIAPIGAMTFSQDSNTLYLAGGSLGAELWSLDVSTPGVIIGDPVPLAVIVPPGVYSSAIQVADLALSWSDATGDADAVMIDSDLASDRGLATAVALSLFTDRRAEADDVPPSGNSQDRRGWWADEFAAVEGDLIGSRLWLLARAKRTNETALRAKQYIAEALAWMLEDRVVSSIDITVDVTDAALEIAVEIQRSGHDPVTFQYAHTWDYLQGSN